MIKYYWRVFYRDWLDDRQENLQFICPNCHSQTEGWCGSLGFSEVASNAKYYREIRKQGRVSELVDDLLLEGSAREGMEVRILSRSL